MAVVGTAETAHELTRGLLARAVAAEAEATYALHQLSHLDTPAILGGRSDRKSNDKTHKDSGAHCMNM